jgi:hypothetical protein
MGAQHGIPSVPPSDVAAVDVEPTTRAAFTHSCHRLQSVWASGVGPTRLITHGLIAEEFDPACSGRW